jgi:hypothetical protein
MQMTLKGLAVCHKKWVLHRSITVTLFPLFSSWYCDQSLEDFLWIIYIYIYI